MISIPKIIRLVAAGQDERLLDEVVRNGRSMPLAVRMRLSEPGVLPAAAAGLALQRVCELTYRPTEASIALMRRVLDRQQLGAAEGSFGSVAGTAIALAGLLGVVHQFDALPGSASPRFIDEQLESAVRSALEPAIESLARAQERGLFEGGAGLIGDGIDSAIVVWQLGFEPRFTSAIRFEALLEAIDTRGLRHCRSTAPLVGRMKRARSALSVSYGSAA